MNVNLFSQCHRWSHEYQEATIEKILRFLQPRRASKTAQCPSQEQPDAAKTDKKEQEIK